MIQWGYERNKKVLVTFFLDYVISNFTNQIILKNRGRTVITKPYSQTRYVRTKQKIHARPSTWLAFTCVLCFIPPPSYGVET